MVQNEFSRLIHQQIEQIRKVDGMIVPESSLPNGHASQLAGNLLASSVPNYLGNPGATAPNFNTTVAQTHQRNTQNQSKVFGDTTVLDLEEEEPASVHMNGYGPAGGPISDVSRTMTAYQHHVEQNGGPFGGPMLVQRPSRDTIRDMYAQVERYPMDSNMWASLWYGS